jgi:hypothetical protein
MPISKRLSHYSDDGLVNQELEEILGPDTSRARIEDLDRLKSELHVIARNFLNRNPNKAGQAYSQIL